MSAAKRDRAKDWLYKVESYLSDPTTRPHAYELVAKESGISVTALRVAAHRAGLTVGPGSPRYALPRSKKMYL